MPSLTNQWRQFQKWIKNLLQAPGDASQTKTFTPAEFNTPAEENPLQSLRVLRHTIRVNLSILEKEITELSAIAENAPPSADVTAAKRLLEKAQGALLLEMALFALSAASLKQRDEILGQVFEAMNQSNQARHLLKACVRE
ncbi:MAG: hypothetical protein P4L53_09015 [Candidatus Obscuribacterales bacterium]|nr:hypothetical protein [Candidatus Obscuribacterales bacterium]